MTTNHSRTARKKQKQKMKKPLWKKIMLSLFIFILALGIGVAAVFVYFISTAPKLDLEKLDVPYASQFYDINGEPFADIGSENRIKIEYDDLPEELIQAVIATEDSRFFKHNGIDLRRILGAIKANIKYGFGSEGASTITQQVVENMFLTPEKSIKLKVQEQWLALKLEREFSKEQIMEMYLNKIFYGSNAYGVAKAAEVYFGKEDLHDLTLVESAMLAGLPQRPSAYNPFQNPDLMEERVDTVLKLMVRHNVITEEEANEARQVNVEDVLTDKRPSSLPYDAFIDQAERELQDKLDKVNYGTAGLKIYTTIDPNIQEHVEFLLTDSEENPIPYPDEDLLAGMAVVDTKTGAIRAIGGSRNREEIRGTNFALDLKRQPGSTIKPLLAYGPAIEYEKWSTYHQINDEPYTPEGSKPIRNWNREYHGWVSARYALSQSLNIPAAKTLVEIGRERAKEFAEGLGITFADKVLDPRDAIGGTRTTVTPLQLAGAYSAFGNEGIYTEPYAIVKVEFPDGSVVDLKPESEAVMSDYTAYMMTDMLKTVMKSGTGVEANIPELPIAGKTGTTNMPDGSPGTRDSWFAGYTTNYSIGIWTGYDKDRSIENTKIPHALFKNTMTEISKDIDTPDFVKPDSVVELGVIKGSNPPALASASTPSDSVVTELFVKGTEPNTTSKKYDGISPVSGLRASYNEGSNSIDVNWNYDKDEDVSFEVSYKVNDGGFKKLTTTSDLQVVISEVQKDATYTIQVTAVSNKENKKSEPRSVTVKLGDKEPEEDDKEDEEEESANIEGLQASYQESTGSLQISWQYSGPAAQFEVDVNGSKQTVQSTSIQINGVTPGSTYSITVTPIIDGKRGSPQSTSVTIPKEEPKEEDTEQPGKEEEDTDDNKPQEEKPDKPKKPAEKPDEGKPDPGKPEDPNDPEDPNPGDDGDNNNGGNNEQEDNQPENEE